MYLLDTNVVSLVAPSRRRTEADEELAGWIENNSNSMFLSVITATEIEDGIARARRKGASRKAADLDEWWSEIRHYYGSRILPLDLTIAQETGRLMDRARAVGINPGFEDIAIAATGSVHELTVLTRNIKDFRPLGVATLNPFDHLP